LVSLGSFWLGRSTRHASLEVSQFPPATGDGCIGGGQQLSEVALSHQVTLELEDHPRELCTVCHGKAGYL
jgi:hypothetical protein